jgi:RimJ/RimL family protein N-acetyltransferase
MPSGARDCLTTERLALRRWRASDRAHAAAMNADSRVMRFLGPLLTREQSEAHVDRLEAHFAEHGFGRWVVEARGVAEFAGWVGLQLPKPELPFGPCVEIGWRLAAEFWGRGYATEAARAALRFGFEQRALGEIVAFTTRDNAASRAVMERLGMRRDERGDFEHPALAPSDPLRPHVLYRLSRSAWDSRQGARNP